MRRTNAPYWKFNKFGERESKLWPKLATRTAAAAENQQAGFVLVSVTVFVSVSVLYIALVAASLFGVS